MEVKLKKKMPFSVLQGERFCINKILARDSSLSRSPHRGVEGVAFKWEMYPGRAKNLLEEDAKPLPLSPSPLMQSLDLPLPNLDHTKPNESASKTSRLIKMVKKRINGDVLKKVGEIVLDRKGMKRREVKKCNMYSSLMEGRRFLAVMRNLRLRVQCCLYLLLLCCRKATGERRRQERGVEGAI